MRFRAGGIPTRLRGKFARTSLGSVDVKAPPSLPCLRHGPNKIGNLFIRETTRQRTILILTSYVSAFLTIRTEHRP